MDLKKLLDFMPEFQEQFVQRYEILNHIKLQGKVGRRMISSNLNLSERLVREETTKLKDLQLVEVSGKGISVTSKGEDILRDFFSIYGELNSLVELSKKLMVILRVKKVIVVSNSLEDNFKNVGVAAANILKSCLNAKDIVGVTGGRTMLAVVNEIYPDHYPDVRVIPARGSIGTNANFQADRIASIMASRLNAKFYNYPIPETLSEESVKLLLQAKEVQEVHHMLKNMDILVFGMGRADVMAQKRGLSETQKKRLYEQGVVGEAFGHYFDKSGYGTSYQDSIGIHLEEFRKIPIVIGVAAGREKAEAVRAIANVREDMYFVLDESIAKEIVSIEK